MLLRVLRLLGRRAVRLFGVVFMYLDLPLAWLRRGRNFVIRTMPGERTIEGAGTVTVFVHFDRAGHVHDYVLHYLQALRAAGSEIVFVSSGPDLASSGLDRIRPLCAAILQRQNVGYDFGAYRDGLRHLGELARFETVILANDSVYGPLFDLTEALSRCDAASPVWGMTDSWDIRYHLQSYFVLLRREAVAHPSFAAFWNGLIPTQSKELVIRRYEVGLTQTLLRAGLRCSALFPYREAALDLTVAAGSGVLSGKAVQQPFREFFRSMHAKVLQGVPLNPLHHMFDYMIRNQRCPFVKRELLLRNPGRIPHVYLWERLIREVSSYDTDMIVRHLKATSRNRVP